MITSLNEGVAFLLYPQIETKPGQYESVNQAKPTWSKRKVNTCLL